ncbi:DNA primase small subunit [Pseudohyphozyma bogoriensis]|nr:DNA primase small subunit [Pseudohyphozyma bogoriensis]
MPDLAGPALSQLFADEEDTKPLPADLASLGDHNSPMVMLTYYRRLFPFKQLFLWLNQDHLPSKNFSNREFALTLQNDVYIRYNSFTTADELKKEIVRLNPSRFEIGPVYTQKPKDRKMLNKANFKPQLRELVFDIDMTDYDAIRTCCQDKAMCKKCWKFISMAVKVLDRALRDDFGFQHLLWVYSGRRGIHCWVSDPEALALTDDQRRAVVNYLEVIKGGAKIDKKVNVARPLHPSLTAALESLKRDFGSVILKEQDCFSRNEQWETVLRLLPEKEVATRLAKEFPQDSKATSSERWKALRQPPSFPQGVSDKVIQSRTEKYGHAIEDIILQYTYPRIDVEVSKHLNHLLKSPFCIHPSTGRVCVPLLATEVEKFDPETCPTVGQLLGELEEASRKGDNGAGWESTSLRPFVELMDRHVEGILKVTRAVKKEKESYSMEF